MTSKSLAGALILTGLFAGPLPARDPGPVETRSRASEGFVPERVDTSELHGPPAPVRERRRLYERVEEDIDV